MAIEAFDPDAAPHATLVRELLWSHLPPLHRKLRSPLVDELARRVVMLERSPIPLVDEPSAGRLAIVALRLVQVLDQIEVDERAAARRFVAFGQLISRAIEPRARRRVLAEYLAEHATDAAGLRGDLRALDRYLGADALRERHARAELALSNQAELALWWFESACRALALDSNLEARKRVIEGGVDELLGKRLIDGRRWQIRWAAGRAMVALLELAPIKGTRVRDAIVAIANNRDEHPWVQAAALEAAVVGDAGGARELVAGRLLAPSGGRDLFVRKLVLRIAVRRLAPATTASLVAELVGTRDPSEHVRIGLVETCGRLEWATARPLLAALASSDEPSPKVRAMVALVARQLAKHDLGERAAWAGALICELTCDGAAFSAQLACEELALLAADVAAHDHARLVELAPSWLAQLAARIVDLATAPVIAEVAAAAAEAIERERDPGRGALTRLLARTAAAITPGGHGRIDLSKLPEPAAAAAADDRMVGRVLADLTRSDWGVSVTREGRYLRIWRGDRFRRRLWRILHELRNPLPNKRQAWVHTVGRTYPGQVRAHPGLLEEATATTVPGERVNVDSEGSWCRHVPTVDDVLDLPIWRRRPVHVVSSMGSVELTPPASVWRRIANRVLVSARYRRLVALRLASLRARRDPQRRRYAELLKVVYGIDVRFEGHPHGEIVPVAPDVNDLFAEPLAVDDAPTSTSLTRSVSALSTLGPIGIAGDWFDTNRHYFTSPIQNSQAALVVFGATLAAAFWTRAWYKRQQLARARAQIPMTIGGWGTRGKSGTERLKAGLLDGLGFEVFVKTTGCEAMFIHSAPAQQPVEIFIYRPYDKATIWEQMAMLRLGARLRCQTFLWECMALNPKYVQLLQHDWMRDDLVTLTNCYPDHEDIQGPAGFDVANVITEFIPKRSVLVTSETSYLPLFQRVCRQRETTMHVVGDREAELVGDDVLELFPYREHPRNIALVTRVATELGIDADLSLLTMAENVVPDLGVLKAYPRCRVRGRFLMFLCGNSANERTGFINNWRRTKLDQLDVEREPERLVVTVVNNRADRIARSEVFARILVRDVAFDRHVLIGTNVKGLRGFIDTALDDYLRELSLIEPDELVRGPVPDVIAVRLARELDKLRIPRPTVEALLTRLAIYARGASLVIKDEAALREALAVRCRDNHTDSVMIDDVRSAVERDRDLTALLEASLAVDDSPPVDKQCPETLKPATRAEVIAHFQFELARIQIRSRLEARLARVFEDPTEDARRRFARDAAAAYRALFLAQVIAIEDPGVSGDQIIERCATCVPPGCDVTLMGAQNIKGTGLDFVYRWLALDKVVSCLREQSSPRLDRRLAALTELEAFEDHGLTDTGLARAVLARDRDPRITPEEVEVLARIAQKVEAIWQRRTAALVEQRKAGWLERLAGWGEGWFDWIDSVRRGRAATQIIDDLVDARISHQRAAVEMRRIVGRLKGGWLVKALRRR